MFFLILIIVFFFLYIRLRDKFFSEIYNLKEEIRFLDIKYSSKILALQKKIKKYEKNSLPLPVDVQKSKIDYPVQTTEKRQMEHAEEIYSQSTSFTDKTRNKQSKVFENKQSIESEAKKIKESEGKQAFLNVFLGIILGPFARLWEMMSSAWKYYRDIDKSPAFFMTVFGITALVTGMGYILKYSFDNYFNELTKSIIILIVSSGILVTGVKIIKKKNHLADFGAALIGLAVIINYLDIYFLDSSYNLISSGLAFMLIALNTALAFLLSLKYRARIISTISLLGGVLSPFFLGSSGSVIFFFVYLFIITLAFIYLAKKIGWQPLVFLSFVLSALCLENLVFFDKSLVTMFDKAIIIHIFAWLFMIASADADSYFGNKKKVSINLFISSLVLLILNIYYAVEASPALRTHYIINDLFSYSHRGMIFALNALAFTVWAVSVYRNKGLSKRRNLVLFAASVMTALGILSIVHYDFSGFLWGLEAFLLLYLGFAINDGVLRKESLILFGISLIGICFSIPGIFYYWQKTFFTTGMANLYLLFILALCFSNLLYRRLAPIFGPLGLMNFHHDISEENIPSNLISEYSWEFGFYGFIREFIPLLAVVIFHIASFYYLDDWGYCLGIIPMFGLIYYSGRRGLGVSHTAGLLHYGLLIAQILISIDHVGTYHFSDQTIYGKMARVEALMLLWMILSFYKRYLPGSRVTPYMENPRQFFYLLIPVLIPLPVRHHIPEYLSVALWAAFGVNIFLIEYLDYRNLRIESGLLMVLATFYSINEYLYTTGFSSYIALAGIFLGLGILAWIYKYRTDTTRGENFLTSCYRFHCTWVFYFAGAIGMTICVKEFNDNMLGASLLLIYFMFLVHRNDLFIPMKLMFKKNINLVRIIAFFTWMTILMNPYELSLHPFTFAVFSSLAIVFYAMYVYFNRSDCEFGKAHVRVSDLIFVNIYIFIQYYSLIRILGYSFLKSGLSICIAIHAVVLIFQSLKKGLEFMEKISFCIFIMLILKLYFNDLAGLQTIEKTVVFTIIGVILLIASYKFQVFKERLTNSAIQQNHQAKIV